MALFDLFRGDSPDAFAKLVMKSLKDGGWPARLYYDQPGFFIDLGTSRLRLETIYRRWLEHPEARRKDAVDGLVVGMFEAPLPETYAEAAPFLLPVVRNRTQIFNGSYRQDPKSSEAFEHPPILEMGPMAAMLVVDKPGLLNIVEAATLRRWGVTTEAAFDRALANLRAKDQRPFLRLATGIYGSDFKDYYDPSRLLMPELFASLGFRGAPIAIAMAPSRLLVADSANSVALETLAVWVEEFVENHADTAAVSYAPLKFNGERWEGVEARGAPLPLRRLAIKQASWDYSAQKELLEGRGAVPAGSGEIARFDVLVHERNGHSFCVWREGSAALLPKTDLIRLSRSDGEAIPATWDGVAAVVGPLYEIKGCSPPLHHPPPWPDPTQWSALAERSKALGWVSQSRNLAFSASTAGTTGSNT